jgi:hypothetical protein
MFLKHISYGLSLKILLAEVILFSLILFGIGIYTNPTDPLFIESKFGYLFYLLPLLVLSLYYGLTAGILMLFSIFIFMLLYYKEVNVTYFLWLFLFTLISSEFNYYWTQNLKHAEEKFKYADDKLRDLARELMLLKISHDQLEKQYIVRPVSIRGLIQEFKEKFVISGNENLALEFLVSLTARLFNIETAAIVHYSFKEDKFNVLYHTGENFNLNPDNILIKRAIEDNSITSVSDYDENNEYLAVIPVKQEDDYYLFIIQDMNFLFLNLDTLLTINLIMFYILKEKELLPKIKDLALKYKEYSLEFLKEVFRMSQLYKNFKVESSLVFIYLKTDSKDIVQLIQKNLRGLDMINVIEKDKDEFILVFLLPFTPYTGAMTFVNRISNIIKENYSVEFLEKNLKYKILLLNEDVDIILSKIYKEEVIKI